MSAHMRRQPLGTLENNQLYFSRKDRRMEGIKINKLEIENVKRIKAVKIEPTANGLTIVGGNNNQGKTSVLDSIAWALGGEKYRPSNHDPAYITYCNE